MGLLVSFPGSPPRVNKTFPYSCQREPGNKAKGQPRDKVGESLRKIFGYSLGTRLGESLGMRLGNSLRTWLGYSLGLRVGDRSINYQI